MPVPRCIRDVGLCGSSVTVARGPWLSDQCALSHQGLGAQILDRSLALSSEVRSRARMGRAEFGIQAPSQPRSHRRGGGGGATVGGAPAPGERSLRSLHRAQGAGWRPGLGTTGSPSQIPFPAQLQPYRVPSLEGSGSGVPRPAAPALGRPGDDSPDPPCWLTTALPGLYS